MADGLLSNIFGAIDSAKRGVSTRYNMLMDNPREYLAQIEERARESNRIQEAGMPGLLAQYSGAPVTPEQQRARQYAEQQMMDVALGFTGNVKPTGLLSKAGQQLPAVPETMYHGTASDIQAFRPGNTVYVSPSPKFAESYAGTQSPNIMPLRADVTKPFNYESAADIQKLAQAYKKLHGEDLFSKKTISSSGGEMKLSQLDKNPISQRLKSGDWTIIEDKKVQEAIKKAGFDAFYIEEGGVKNLGVYDPTKLKSVFSSGGLLSNKPINNSMQLNEAHQVASKNAEKMLGLPPGNTAMDRAKAMGYDMSMYHGTDVPIIEAFDPEITKIIKGIFSTNNTKTASKYAEEAGLKKRAESFGMESSPNVLPLLIKSESHTKIPKFDKETIDRFRKYGDKGVYRDEMGVAVTFDPSQIRSRFAAFDPARANEADLLAGVIPFGLLSGKDQLESKKEKKSKK